MEKVWFFRINFLLFDFYSGALYGFRTQGTLHNIRVTGCSRKLKTVKTFKHFVEVMLELIKMQVLEEKLLAKFGVIEIYI